MAVTSSKQKTIQQVQFILNGGLNYAQSPTEIKDNELRRADNFIYDPETDYLITRPGTTYAVNSALPGAITNMCYYEKTPVLTYLVCASAGNLYYMASPTAWTLIGALNDSTTIPAFLVFDNKLLIADGGTNIKTWDGVTYSTIAGSPAATALSRIKNRVVANHVSELDSVYLSGPYDALSPETAWDTSGDAIGFKAGYGDLMTVNAFGVFKSDLIISKKGTWLKNMYRLNTDDSDTTNWYVQEVSHTNCAQNTQSMCSAWNNVFFVDTNGFKSVLGVETYGDLQVDIVGRKINVLFLSQANCDFMTYIPKYNSIWFGMGDRVYCYTEHGSLGSKTDTTTEYFAQNLKPTPAFTSLQFKQGKIRAIVQVGEIVYLAGNDGWLYKLDESISTDAVGLTTQSYSSSVRTKTLVPGGDCILKKSQWSLKPKETGVASLLVYTDEVTGTQIKTVNLTGDGTDLYDATGYLHDATEYLYDQGAYAYVETSRNRVRGKELAFELMLTSGRVGIEWIKADIAMVEGGD